MTDPDQRMQKLEVLLKAVRAWRRAPAGRAAVEADHQIELALRDLIERDADKGTL